MSAVPVRAAEPQPASAVLPMRSDDTAPKRASTRHRRVRAPEWVVRMLAMATGIAVFVIAWAIVARKGGAIPGRGVVWNAAVTIFSDPFYSKGPNDQGIGWNVLSSLKRVTAAFQTT